MKSCTGSCDPRKATSLAGKSNRSAMQCVRRSGYREGRGCAVHGTLAVGFRGTSAQGCPRTGGPFPKSGANMTSKLDLVPFLINTNIFKKATQPLDFSLSPSHFPVNSCEPSPSHSSATQKKHPLYTRYKANLSTYRSHLGPSW